MQQKNPYIGLIRTGSACWHHTDPELVKNWLSEHQMPAFYHPDTQNWLSAEQRAAILLEFLLDDRYTTLWAFRGGEGAADTLPYLQQHAQAIAQANPKLLLGISDATAFLNYFNQTFDWPVAYACGAVGAAKGKIEKENVQTTLALIRDWQIKYQLTHLTPLNESAKQSTKITAKLCGGNLSMVAISIKDIWEMQTANKILVLEDINEKAYQIARYLNYFKRIHLLDNTAAIIFGDFFIEQNPEHQAAILRTLQRFAESCSFPVLHTAQFGHRNHCTPLPFYRQTELHLGAHPTLIIT